jgi:enoyl-CoA hydratase/carnithine racemase
MSCLSLHVENGIALLTLDQPDSRVNVLDREMWADLDSAFSELGKHADVRGLIVVSAKPGIFIAGADLKELANVPGPDHPPTREFIEFGVKVLNALAALPFPTVACVDGAALGGGLEVALACDYRLAGTNPKARFGLPEVTLGLIPGLGGTQRLPRLVGPISAIEILIQNQQLDAEAARYRGLVSKIVPSENLVAEATSAIHESQKSKGWQAERLRKQRLLEIDREGMSIADMSEGNVTEAKLNALTINPDALNAYRELVNGQMRDKLCRKAALAAIDVVEKGGVLPLDQALHLETTTFLNLAGSPEAHQLIAEFFASRKK